MDRAKIVHKFLDRGILLDPELLDRITEMPAEEVEDLLQDMESRGVNVAGPWDLNHEASRSPEKSIEVPAPRLEVRTEPLTVGSDSRVDYLKHFQNRFDRIASILRGGNGYQNSESIREVKSGVSRPVTTIGMVCEKDAGKSGDSVVVEDGTDRITLAPSTQETEGLAGQLILDEIIGIKGRYDGNDLIHLDRIDFPDIEEQDSPLAKERIYAAFLSDLHFGAENFMKEALDRFIDFLNGRHEDPEIGEIGSLTKFVILCGDLIHADGGNPLGNYLDLSRALGQIPDDTIIFSIPGENDTAGILEPQAGFLDDATQAFSHLQNFRTGSNPCMIHLNSIPVLLYHGRSLTDWRNGGENQEACQIMRKMLLRRHMAPTYGLSVPISPGTKDPFIIGETPRIFQTGHEHECCSLEYKGVLLLATPSWMASNGAEEAGTAFIVDLSTLMTRKLNFAH